MSRRKLTAFIILALSAVLIALGLFAGEFKVVWQKAATVCLECIGIG
ncbi:MAG: CD1871A family CXXC motif-containing protein [Candidatus Saccharicenans sp.]